jgi:hydroxymethylpyrimidine/phosphomethylpyrimidine kinase
LSVAGSDCSGGAGIQADLKAFSANGTFGMSVITSVVAENTSRVISVFNLPEDEIKKQIDAVFEDITVDAVKLGMLPTSGIICAVAEKLAEYKPPIVVCDPVMVATSGDALSDGSTVSALCEKLFPIEDLITPNIPEAEVISGVKINSIDDFDKAAEVIMSMGVKNLLLKGGHFRGECIDILYTSEKNGEDSFFNYMFCEKRIDSPNTHGTGCTLSSAVAANLANGMDMPAAVESAKRYVTNAIEKSFTVGKGHSPVNHFYEYYQMKGIN